MQVLQGTWEEVKEHEEELAGKQVTLIVADPAAENGLNRDYKPGRFEKYFGVISSGKMQGRNAEADFARIMDEKAARDLAKRRKLG